MNKTLAIITLAALTGCTTPQTVMHHPETGQIARCGGNVSASMAGGVVGYHIQKSSDARCVEDFKSNGFQVQ